MSQAVANRRNPSCSRPDQGESARRTEEIQDRPVYRMLTTPSDLTPSLNATSGAFHRRFAVSAMVLAPRERFRPSDRTLETRWHANVTSRPIMPASLSHETNVLQWATGFPIAESSSRLLATIWNWRCHGSSGIISGSGGDLYRLQPRPVLRQNPFILSLATSTL